MIVSVWVAQAVGVRNANAETAAPAITKHNQLFISEESTI